eukprot:COSAG01_NODE_10717_length_2095_cov_6.519539_1_plen_652_part_01
MHPCTCPHGSGVGLSCLAKGEQQCSSCDDGFAPRAQGDAAGFMRWHNASTVRVSGISQLHQGGNLALRRPVVVNSECYRQKPTSKDFLTDGNHYQTGCPGDSHYWQSCQVCRETKTSGGSQASAWARVDLKFTTRVRRVVIWPRCDRKSDEMAGAQAEVQVSKGNWLRCGGIASDVGTNTKTGFTFACNIEGAAVRVSKPSTAGEWFSMSEIQVYDTTVKEVSQVPFYRAMGIYVATDQVCHQHPVFMLKEGITEKVNLDLQKMGAKVIPGPGVTSPNSFTYIDMNTAPETYTQAPQGISPNCNKPLHVTVDLGGVYVVTSITVWNRYGDGRRICGQKLALSTVGVFAGEEAVVMDSQGAYGKKETAAGSHYAFTPQRARYVRHWMSRSDKSEYAHWIEMAVYGDESGGAYTLWSAPDNAGWHIGPRSALTIDKKGCRSSDSTKAWLTSECGDNMFACNNWLQHDPAALAPRSTPVTATPIYASSCAPISATCSFDVGICGWTEAGSSRWLRQPSTLPPPSPPAWLNPPAPPPANTVPSTMLPGLAAPAAAPAPPSVGTLPPPSPPSGGGKGRRRMLRAAGHEPQPFRTAPLCMDYDTARASSNGCKAPSFVLPHSDAESVEAFSERWLDWMCCRAVSSAPTQWSTNVAMWK